MTETTKYHQTKNAKMHNSQAEESTIQLAKHHRDDGGSDTEEQGDGLQLRVLLKWHICFFMRRICDVVSTYIHIVYRYSIFFPYDGMARRWRASLSIVLKSLFALHKSASSRCAMYLKFKHIT